MSIQNKIDFLRTIKNQLKGIFINNLYWRKKITNKYDLANGLPVIDIEDILPHFNEEIELLSFSFGGSLHTDYALIKGICKKFKNCSYFEIGTWKGESVVNASSNCKIAYTLNLSNNEIKERIGFPDEYTHLMGLLAMNNPKIIQLKGDSLTYDFNSLNKKFDVIFIDGDHKYEMVKNDTEKIFTHLVHENSIVIWHDYGYNPEEVRYEVLLGILDGLPKHLHNKLYHISETSCAVFLHGNYHTYILKRFAKPIRKFKITLQSEKTK